MYYFPNILLVKKKFKKYQPKSEKCKQGHEYKEAWLTGELFLRLATIILFFLIFCFQNSYYMDVGSSELITLFSFYFFI